MNFKDLIITIFDKKKKKKKKNFFWKFYLFIIHFLD